MGISIPTTTMRATTQHAILMIRRLLMTLLNGLTRICWGL